MNIIQDVMNLSSTKQVELQYSSYFMTNEKMQDWLFVKFHEWAIAQGKKVTQADFARYLGVSPSTLSMWINKKQPPDRHSADLIALKLGPEVYEILQIEPPEISSITNLPHEVRSRLEGALYETNSELASRGLSASDPEAVEITIKIFEKHGFKYTRTTKS